MNDTTVAAEVLFIRIAAPEEWQASVEAREQLAKCVEFLNSVPGMGDRLRLASTLVDSLERIGNMHDGSMGGPVQFYKDFAPLSFGWRAGGLTGGLIYHGPHDGHGDGGAPTFSVSLTDIDGWQLHT